MLAEELPWIPVYVRLEWAVVRPEVRGLRLHPSGFHRLDTVSLEGGGEGAGSAPGGETPSVAATGSLRSPWRHDRRVRALPPRNRARVEGSRPAVVPERGGRRGSQIPKTPMPPISETTVEMIQWVFPEHAGAPGPDPRRPHDAVDRRGGHPGRLAGRPGHRRPGRHGRHRLPAAGQGGRDRHPARPGRVRRAQLARGGRARVVGERGDGGPRGDAQLAPRLRERRRARASARGSRDDRAPRRRRDRAGRGGPAPPRAAARPSGRRAARTRAEARGRRRGRALALRVGALGAARGRALRQHDVSRQDADGHRRGRRHPLDALLPWASS